MFFDTDLDADNKDINWCDRLEKAIELDDTGHCSECPEKGEEDDSGSDD